MAEQPQTSTQPKAPDGLDALIVGAGFAGLYMLHRLRGLGLSVRVLEAGAGIGGTWYWNRYPGARCDIESMEYSYQFSQDLQQDWNWTERYATQPEILRYIEHVANRFDLHRDVQLNSRVAAARYDPASPGWTLETADGERFSARFCIMATGCLSAPYLPDIAGLDDFTGLTVHTGAWPASDIDLASKTVGVIGTGSSGVQSIPMIAQQAEHLYVFQRTPTYSVPAHNHPLDPEVQRTVKADYGALRARAKQNRVGIDYTVGQGSVFDASPGDRERVFEERWGHGGLPFLAGFADLFESREANDIAADFVRRKIREIVDDPATAEALSPHTIIGCKRLCVDTDYYKTFNRPNVTLVDVQADPIERIVEGGLITAGKEYALDIIVFATGFDAITGALDRIDVRGEGGVSLKSKWKDGARGYLGLGLAAFPNLFTINGPGSPSVLSNVLQSIEQHVDWIAECIDYMGRHGFVRVEPEKDAEDRWAAHVNALADASVYPFCNSWYIGANIPGKPRAFLPYIGFPEYTEKCEAIIRNGYQGFVFGTERHSERRADAHTDAHTDAPAESAAD